MRTPDQRQADLIEALRPDVPYMDAYKAVRQALEAVVPPGQTFTTEQMVELVAPSQNWIHGDREMLARRRVYKALNALAEHDLKAWVTLEEPVKGRFGMMRRKSWRRVSPCEFCNGTGIAPVV